MSARRRFSEKPPLAADIGPEDGIDPRYLPRGEPRKLGNRKALQLCAQVARTLNTALAACGDDVLRELSVSSVTPAPDSTRLLVLLTSDADPNDVQARLGHASGRLRHEVAAAINRKKVPELTYRIVGRSLPGDPAPPAPPAAERLE